jgi:hypothetical protein
MSMRSNDRSRASRPSGAHWVGLSVLLAAVASFWWLMRGSEPRPTEAATAAIAAPEPSITAAPAPPPQRERAGDGIPIMAAGTTDRSTDEPRHPHPITPTHERNFRQISMVAVMDGAADVGDVEELRRVNRKYRDEYPENSLLQDGYDLIADCLERRTTATEAAAQRYWNSAIASNLRRYVRRHCLD